MKKYDYLIVGAGLFGAVFAHEAAKQGKRCLVIDKRDHIGGNVYTKEIEGINVHVYGAHIFHTNDKDIWEYVNSFAEFNRFTNSPIARYKDELYNLPFNMNTFYAMWGVKTPQEAKEIIARQVQEAKITQPKNLEEQAISLVGTDIYFKLIKGYTEKQWGKDARDLPPFIIKRLPVRFTFDNNYFSDRYQGIPIGGYTNIIQKMLEDSEVLLNCDYFDQKPYYDSLADKILYTGSIDRFFDYCYGELEYRSLRFETEILDIDNYQGNAVINYTEREIPYTRIIEHKHFEFGTQPKTVITREYPAAWSKGQEAYYPVNDEKNNALYEKYNQLAQSQDKVIFGGRLGLYKYLDMHNVIKIALEYAQKELFS
ncbi:MAG: UDP-galactopyranose mutase [Clostridiales bacterium]|nr:UDP-galactopyranose mutase [Clostridiales bacterium]